jgi:putative heme iron utilization protein
MADPITKTVSDRICKHMNEDHADAVLIYAQAFGNLPAATAATMNSIEPESMEIVAEVNGETLPVQIKFDHVLQDSEDAHQTLIAMIKQARQKAK